MMIVDYANMPDFSTMVLSPEELEDLRLLSQKAIENTGGWPTRLKGLCDLGLVDYEPDFSNGISPKGTYKISQNGKMYLQYLARRKSELRFANTLSVLALAVSIVALIVSIVR